MKIVGTIASVVFLLMLVFRAYFFFKFAFADAKEPIDIKIKKGLAAAFNPYPGGPEGVVS